MSKKLITIEREIGLWGTKFKADIEVTEGSAKLVKGFVKGFTGLSLSLFKQSFGIGISDWDFWITEEDIDSPERNSDMVRVIKAYVSFRRIHFFVFNERQTLLIGEHKIPLKSGRRFSVKKNVLK